MVSITYSLIIVLVLMVMDTSIIFKWIALFMLLIIAVASKFHYAYHVTNEICDEFGIRFLKVKPKQSEVPLINVTV